MRSLLQSGIICCIGTFLIAGTALAESHASGKGNSAPTKSQNGQGNTQVSLRLNLLPSDSSFLDLVSAKGKVDFQTKNGRTQFKVKVQLPFPAPSLGIIDEFSAVTSFINFEFARAGIVYNSCSSKLESFNEIDDSKLNHQIIAQNASKKKAPHFAKGVCSNGIPAMQLGDSVVGYTSLNGVRVNFLINQ